MTDVVCIGRNTKEDPLSKADWESFIREVTSLFATLYFVGEGIGIYEDKKEDSYCCVGILAEKDKLSSLAKKYKQECIAYLCGETQFVRPPELGIVFPPNSLAKA